MDLFQSENAFLCSETRFWKYFSPKISEIDERDKINVIEAAEIKTTPLLTGRVEIFWGENDKKLYILSEGRLYSSTALLP